MEEHGRKRGGVSAQSGGMPGCAACTCLGGERVAQVFTVKEQAFSKQACFSWAEAAVHTEAKTLNARTDVG